MGRKTTDARRKREKGDARLRDSGHRGLLGFLTLDGAAYRAGALPSRTKALLGLTASLVLRADEAVVDHLDHCATEGVSRPEILEAFHVALVVGGSTVTPHLRTAMAMLDDLLPEKKRKAKRKRAAAKKKAPTAKRKVIPGKATS